MTPPIAVTAEQPAVLTRQVRPESRSAPRVANVRVPRHIASVLDCAAPLGTLIDGALTAGVEFLSLQLAADTQALAELLNTEGSAWIDRGVRFQKLHNTPADAQQQLALNALDRLVQQSDTLAHAPRLTVTLAIAYDTKRDIAHAASASAHADGTLATPDQLLQHMAARDLPPVDLFLSTGGSRRLSAFLLWHAAYAELGFLRASWADFTPDVFRSGLQDYATRTRTFGAVPAKS
jgi:hypothetical protein